MAVVTQVSKYNNVIWLLWGLNKYNYSKAKYKCISGPPELCGVIERGSKLHHYCFCYTDYCNTASLKSWSLAFTFETGVLLSVWQIGYGYVS